MKIFRNFIAGSWSEPSTGDYFENVNPADTSDVIGRFPLSDAADVDKAVASAKRGFESGETRPRQRAVTCSGASAICSRAARTRSRT